MTVLPDVIPALTALVTLDLDNNDITSLPEAIVALTGLEVIIVVENPLTRPQSDAVEAWLTRKMNGESRVLPEYLVEARLTRGTKAEEEELRAEETYIRRSLAAYGGSRDDYLCL